MIAQIPSDVTAARDWHACRFLTCSVLPVRMACNLRCPFCFSRSSVSALRQRPGRLADTRRRGLLPVRPRRVGRPGSSSPAAASRCCAPRTWSIWSGWARRFFDEIACFTNGTFLTRELARRLRDAGLSYLCYSRHAADDEDNRLLMGAGAPRLADLVAPAGTLQVRATCVMARGYVDECRGRLGIHRGVPGAWHRRSSRSSTPTSPTKVRCSGLGGERLGHGNTRSRATRSRARARWSPGCRGDRASAGSEESRYVTITNRRRSGS